MENFYESCPKKVFLSELSKLTPPIPVWVLGKVEQTVGTQILIINDGTGRAKISNCDSGQTPDDKTWMKKDSQCCVIGLLVKNKGLPEIAPKKYFCTNDQPIDNESWKHEVEELALYLQGKITPNIATPRYLGHTMTG